MHVPHPGLEACVIVPARNEAAGLEAALAALSNQIDLHGQPLSPERWEVLLLINNSDDDSFAIAKRFQHTRPGFPLHVEECHFDAKHAHIGHIRKLLMDAACERLSSSRSDCSLILSTDADTEVEPDWVAQNGAEARRGAEAIGGRISLKLRDVCKLDPQTRDIQRLSDEYYLLVARLEDQCDPQAHDQWPRHHQHFGGSMAVRPDIYRQVGGVPSRKTLEDVALYEALVRQDVKFRHSPHVCVHTSGRLQGRTEVGLAEQLTRWSQGAPVVMVPSVRFYRTLFSTRKSFRATWQSVQAGEGASWAAIESLAAKCGATRDEVRDALKCRWFGTAFETLGVRRKFEDDFVLQPLREAVDELKKVDAVLRRFEPGDTGPIRERQEVIMNLIAG